MFSSCGAGWKGYPLGPAGWQPASCAGRRGTLWVARSLPNCPTMVGVLLPSTVAGALVNLSLTLRGAVPVNLNFTAGADAMQSAIEQCGISTVVTSRAFLAKARIQPLPGTVYI